VDFDLTESYQDRYALYAYKANMPGSLGLYSVVTLPTPSAFPTEVDAASLWSDYNSAWAFAIDLSVVPDALPALAKTCGLSATSKTQRNFLWWTADQPLGLIRAIKSSQGSSASVATAGAIVPFGNIELAIPGKTILEPAFDDGTVAFTSSGGMTFQREGQGGGVSLSAFDLGLSHANQNIGGIQFTTGAWDSYAFFYLFQDHPVTDTPQGGQIRYFVGPNAEMVKFPLFTLESYPAFSFRGRMHPLALFDPEQTAFIFSGAIPAALNSTNARLTTGEPATVIPAEGFGFCLGRRPSQAEESAASSYAYLAPVGPAEVASGGSGPASVMCGVAGQEYLRLGEANRIRFVGGGAAYAPLFADSKPERSDDAPLLLPDFTTSWITIDGVTEGQTSGQGYYSQPKQSVNYGDSGLPVSISYPTAIAPWLTNPTASAAPMGLYGGALDSELNPGWSAAKLMEFETTILARARPVALLGTDRIAPVFQSLDGQPLSGRTTTRQGLLVQLNDAPTFAAAQDEPEAGTWQSLILAKTGEQVLSFDAGATGVVDPILTAALSNDQVFAVLNNWAIFDQMHDSLTIEAFTFQVRPPPDAPKPERTLLVFKYDATRSLIDLMNAPEAWAERGHLCPNQAAASDALREMWEIAERTVGTLDDPFVYFREIARAPGWTGILSVNAFVYGSSPDLDMILDGISGQLMAHHFGVELNQIRRDPPTGASPMGQPDIDFSATFGAIYYVEPATAVHEPAPPPPVPDYLFRVEELVVVVQNSAIGQFHCRAALTANKLLDRPVWLISSHGESDCGANNKLCVEGRYQLIDGVGVVTFAVLPSQTVQGPVYFSFTDPAAGADAPIRVLDRFVVSSATWTRTDQTESQRQAGEDYSATSRFSLAGELLFNERPFPGTSLDLYSFGNLGRGVPIRGLAFDIVSAQAGSSWSQTIAPNLSNVSVSAPSDEALRPNGLVGAFPLNLTTFLCNSDGLDAKALAGTVVGLPDLIAKDADGIPTQSFAGTKPTFALRFDLPLGALGALSEVQVGLNAGLLLGWGPSDATLDNDGATVYVQLPQLSAGALGFNLQGLVRTTFSNANLAYVESAHTYAILFNNVALSIYGIQLPPGIIIDFILFADPENRYYGKLAWCLAAAKPEAPLTSFAHVLRLPRGGDPILEAKTVAELSKALRDVYDYNWPLAFPDSEPVLQEMWALPIEVTLGDEPRYSAISTERMVFADQLALDSKIEIHIFVDPITNRITHVSLSSLMPRFA